MEIGTVAFIKPAQSWLQQYIKGYYIHQSDDPHFHAKITFFQNVTSSISIYLDTDFAAKGQDWVRTHAPGKGFTTTFVCKVPNKQNVEFIGPLNRLAIVFYPLGINHFIQAPLSDLIDAGFSTFNYFDELFAALLPQVYEAEKMEVKRGLLDAFFTSQFQEFSEERLLYAVGQILASEDKVSVENIAKELGVSRRTLLRLFKKHLYYSVEEYIAVVKFRQALYNYQAQQNNPNLTQIAYESNYYDQSDFINQVKSRSGLTPKMLFEQLRIVDDTLFWTL